MSDIQPTSDRILTLEQNAAQRAYLLVMIPLSAAVLPDALAFFDHFAEHWPEPHALQQVEQKDETLMLQAGNGAAAIALMRNPIPWHELEGPCHTAWYWPEAADTLRDHQAHLLISLTGGDDDQVERVMLMTRLAASAAATVPGALGVYWCHGTLVHDAPVFIEMVGRMKRDELPVYLWVDFRITQSSPDSFTLFTTGMVALGFMELEMVDLVADPQQMIAHCYNIAHYLLDHGPVLEDEDGVAVSEETRLVAHHQPSHLDPRQTVYRLTYD